MIRIISRDFSRDITSGFTSSKLYEHLDYQGHTILTGLSKQKQEAKALYQKVADQNESLKGLWVAKMRLKGQGLNCNSFVETRKHLQGFSVKGAKL